MQQIQLATKNTHQAVHACHTHRTSEGEYQHENHEKHGSYSVYDLGVRLETDWFAHVGSQLHTLLQHRMHPALRYTKQGGAKSQIQLRIGIRKDTVPVVGFRAGVFFFFLTPFSASSPTESLQGKAVLATLEPTIHPRQTTTSKGQRSPCNPRPFYSPRIPSVSSASPVTASTVPSPSCKPRPALSA